MLRFRDKTFTRYLLFISPWRSMYRYPWFNLFRLFYFQCWWWFYLYRFWLLWWKFSLLFLFKYFSVVFNFYTRLLYKWIVMGSWGLVLIRIFAQELQFILVRLVRLLSFKHRSHLFYIFLLFLDRSYTRRSLDKRAKRILGIVLFLFEHGFQGIHVHFWFILRNV